jgi:hypothetical protein
MVGTLLMTAGAWLLGDLVIGMMIGRVLRERPRHYSTQRGLITSGACASGTTDA